MQCEQAQGLIGAFHDKALSVADMRTMQDHVKSCKACGVILKDYERIGEIMKAEGRTPMPLGLSARVSAALAQADDNETPLVTGKLGSYFSNFEISKFRQLFQQAAMLAAVSAISVFATISVINTGNHVDALEHDVLNAHLRSLLLDTPVQVASTDQHTVRPWFAGKVDFSPAARDLTAAGFPLIGGRLDYVNDQRVGALVYKHDKHLINVFAWASPGNDQSPQLSTRSGYNIVSWTSQGVTYWAVSDINAEELRKLQRAF
jgi:anti-sigma factor RsiW